MSREVNAALSRDCAIALQSGQQSEALSQEKKKERSRKRVSGVGIAKGVTFQIHSVLHSHLH